MVSALLPRPLALAGGVCLTGLQVLKEVTGYLYLSWVNFCRFVLFGPSWTGIDLI